ncbi:MAG: glycosyltransferase family 87 protein [Bacteroidota bacterium]
MQFLLKDIRLGKWAIPLPAFLWFALAAIAATLEMSRGLDDINNFLIYKSVFWHSVHLQNLYLPYPQDHADMNHYGPFFSLIIAPFAVLPTLLGCFLWCLANAWVLFYAISHLPISTRNKNVVLLIGMIEMMTATHSVQFNTMLTGWILLSFVFTERKQDVLATLFIVAGFYVKIYGIVGIAFFFFSENKLRFFLSFLGWLIVFFCLPMILSSPSFVIQSYQDWAHSLVEKNATNIIIDTVGMQDISLMGMVRRIFKIGNLPNYWFTIPAAFLYILPFFRKDQYPYLNFRLSYLALALIGVVIFSSSAESPTYVIAVIGLAIWYVIQKIPRTFFPILLLIITFILTILSPTDIVPRNIRELIVHYSLKALPCCIVWVVLIYELLRKDFSNT